MKNGFDRKLLMQGAIMVVGILLAAGATWIVNTTISHGNRIAAMESGDKKLQADVAYVRTRVDEMYNHLLTIN